MRAKRESVEATSTAPGSPVAPESARRGSENEEWAWMVDEDPVFYLNEAGTTISGRSE